MREPRARRFDTLKDAEQALRESRATGFVLKQGAHFIAVVMHEGKIWGLVSPTQMVHLDEW